MLLLPVVLPAQSTWTEDPSVEEQLASRQVVVRVAIDPHGSHMHVRAAIAINASSEAVWSVLTDCEHAAQFIPGVKSCKLLESAPDGSWATVDHEVKYSWMMPSIHSVFHADYQPPRRIEFHQIRGDMKNEEGAWVLEHPSNTPSDSNAAALPETVVEYEMNIEPGFWIPKPMLRHALRAELPAALTALRTRAENSVAHVP